MSFNKDKEVEEQVEFHKIRITLTSTKVKEIEKGVYILPVKSAFQKVTDHDDDLIEISWTTEVIIEWTRLQRQRPKRTGEENIYIFERQISQSIHAERNATSLAPTLSSVPFQFLRPNAACHFSASFSY